MLVMKPISRIDAERGKLYFRGHDATDLAIDYCFEDVMFLLLHGHLPNEPESTIFRKKMRELRSLSKSEISPRKSGKYSVSH